ncbi:pyridoxal phosphate-dependent aminotransferase [Clostridium fermenticellae]|uniref:Aminotransferase n=1 Tax=Clostridium fermenticellae TaxID=2068654 RepID=A0A386H484_9CLOT|nr:pyridoxal phosphate-dependent aminotransferase [Clostridium fermenticellae]AYD40522.1 pyridoxal phosphate-dependent aminotransferase [Clostridium fermenticellae]
MEHLSELAINYPASGIRKMFDLAEQYDDVIKLTLGEPNFDTPVNIKEAVKKAVDEGYTHYSPNAGMDELRQAVANYYKKYSKDYTFENVMITVGGLEALTLSLFTTINSGDEVIIPDPGFPNYEGQVMMAGGKPVPVPIYEENDFKIRAEDIEKAITPKTKAIVLNSPSNPLGSVLNKSDIEAIAKIAEKYDLLVYSDEVYDKIVYDDCNSFSMAEIPGVRNRVIVINSFSKSYAMTGWRLGYIVADKNIISNMPKLQEGMVSCVPTFIQKAGIEALNGSQDAVKNMIADYARRRDILIDGLNNIPGITCKKSPGSFYAFPNIKSFGKGSQEFAEELVRGARVVVVPGSAFGKMGEGYLRLVFANSDENLQEAIARIDEYIRKTY